MTSLKKNHVYSFLALLKSLISELTCKLNKTAHYGAAELSPLDNQQMMKKPVLS